MVKYSTKFTEKKFNKKVGNIASHLYEGEDLLFFGPCARSFSTVNYVAITTMRVIALFEGQVKISLMVGDVESISPVSGEKKFLLLKKDGERITFAASSAEDCEAIISTFNDAVGRP